MPLIDYIRLLVIVTILNIIISLIEENDVEELLGRALAGVLLVSLVAIVVNIFRITIN